MFLQQGTPTAVWARVDELGTGKHSAMRSLTWDGAFLEFLDRKILPLGGGDVPKHSSFQRKGKSAYGGKRVRIGAWMQREMAGRATPLPRDFARKGGCLDADEDDGLPVK